MHLHLYDKKCEDYAMSFCDLDIKGKYRSSDTLNIGKDFIQRMLENSVSYKRAVGFFSSSALIYISHGLLNVANHFDNQESVIRLIVSPRLSKQDVEAIKEGYKSKKEVIEKALLDSFEETEDKFELERLNVICHLIASGAMDIKVASTTYGENDLGMYHEKIGIFEDENGNKVAFEGSLNESATAYIENFEQIRVFKSWENSSDYVSDIEQDFDELWENHTHNVKVYNFPEAVKKRLFKYKKETFNKNIEEDEKKYRVEELLRKQRENAYKIPDLYQYQKDAISQWFSNRCRGIFDMATGTGKTYTALGAIVSLRKRTKNHLATIIVVPYQHLVEQWVEEAEAFNIKDFIIAYSNPKYSDYYSRLRNAVFDYNNHVITNFSLITTYATYKTEKVQKELKKLNGNVLFVADEAHNSGSFGMAGKLIDKFQFRLGLSATIDRYRDQEGTNQIFEYFGKKCIEYPLEKAIDDDRLCQYEYYPIKVYLDEEEREEYIRLSALLAKQMIRGEHDELILSKSAEKTAIKRARIIATARSKIPALREELKAYSEEHHILVYCGTSKIAKETDEESSQIKDVLRMMGKDLKMKVDKYTSEENAMQRKMIINRYKKGDDLQALVAIKCLDEGVNIPAIKTAFILASSTNPREYIQRRGRVLRKFRGKKKAVIYDFVCLPTTLDEFSQFSDREKNVFKSLANNEVNRVVEFASHSLNAREGLALVEEVKMAFGLYEFKTDELEELDWLEEENEKD